MFDRNELELLADVLGTELGCLAQRKKSIDPHDPTQQDDWADALEAEKPIQELQDKIQNLIQELK